MESLYSSWGALTISCACAVIGPPSTAVAADASYPTQPIKVIVPATPAGGSDVITRVLTNAVATATGWTFVVDNRPGASGIIGTDAVAKSKPDGLTLGMGQTATLAINSELFRRIPYDPLKDFTAIALVAAQPVVLVVRADSPFKSLNDLVAAHRKRPLTMGSAGAGTVGQLVSEMLAQRVGSRFTLVPYKGASPALADVVGGQTDCMFTTPSSALPLLQSGHLKALAISSSERVSILPGIPTVAEAGFRDFKATEWKVLVGPAGMPEAVVQRINLEVQRALALPSVMAKLQSDGSLPMSSTPQQAQTFLRAEFNKWTEVVRSAGTSKTN